MNQLSPGNGSLNDSRKENMANQSIISEFWEFLKVRKSYWLLPIVVVLLLLGALIVFTQTSAVAPFIYALF
jgi:hypothetical protein